MYVVPYLNIQTYTCYLLHSMCIMHTYSSCIILTLCFAAIIDSSGSCIRIRVQIAKEIFSRLQEMEQQQGGNWTLEDIKGALIDDMKAMM